jgi:hypothetical protein
MNDTKTRDITGTSRRPFRFRPRLAQAVVAGTMVIGVLAVAAPSWAGPMMGC